MRFPKAVIAMAVLAPTATAQTTFLDTPTNKWVTTFLPMRDNNGLVWAPDNSLLYATAIDGTVAAMNPADGIIAWTFLPEGDGTVPFFCNGEVSFSADGSYVIYAVSEGETCKVYALSHPTGALLWSSPALEGRCEGTPHATTTDENVFVTHNSDAGTVGHFSVLDKTGADVTVSYNFTDPDAPFGPFGVFRQPSPGGNYPGGISNTNDIAVWANKPEPTATFGDPGKSFAFQMAPAFSIAPATVTQLLAETSWRHTAPPLLAANGQQMFWLNSRSQVRAWTTLPFSVGPDGTNSFDRGTPPFKAAPYTPVVDDMTNPTLMCGGPADTEFACLSLTGIAESVLPVLWTEVGTGLVLGNPLMSTGGDRVYWVDTAGVVRAADPSTGTAFWVVEPGIPVEANPTLSSDGAIMFFADSTGNVVAWDIAESTLPPPEPTTAGVTEPTASPGGSEESFVPTLLTDTSMPSSSPFPVLTASPVTTPSPDDTSAAPAVAVSTVVLAVVSVMCVWAL